MLAKVCPLFKDALLPSYQKKEPNHIEHLITEASDVLEQEAMAHLSNKIFR